MKSLLRSPITFLILSPKNALKLHLKQPETPGSVSQTSENQTPFLETLGNHPEVHLNILNYIEIPLIPSEAQEVSYNFSSRPMRQRPLKSTFSVPLRNAFLNDFPFLLECYVICRCRLKHLETLSKFFHNLLKPRENLETSLKLP